MPDTTSTPKTLITVDGVGLEIVLAPEVEAHARRGKATPAETEAHGRGSRPKDPETEAHAHLELVFPPEAEAQTIELRYRPPSAPGESPEVELHAIRGWSDRRLKRAIRAL